MVKYRLLITVMFVVALVIGCTPQAQQAATPTPIPTSVVPEKPTYVVQRGTVEEKVQFTARVSPLQEEDLFFKSGGFISIVYIEKDDWVEEGTILAELEVEDLRNQLALVELDYQNALNAYNSAVQSHERQVFNAQMSLELAKLRLERAKLSPPSSNLLSMKYAVQDAKEYLEETKIVYKEALDRPWEPQKVRDAMLKNIAKAERNYELAQGNYQYALLKDSQSLATYQIDIQLQEKEIERAEQELTWLEEGVSPSLLQAVEGAQIKVERIQRQVENAQLIAPFDGEITAVAAIPGKAVEARKSVAVIADPNSWDITANLPTNQMNLLEEGMECQVTISRFPGEVFTCIIQVMPYPYGTGGGSVQIEDMDQRTHIVFANPEDAPSDVRVGDMVKVMVMVEQSLDALWLPPAAVRTFEGRNFVMVRGDDGRLRKVDVKLGIQSEDAIEILDGLEEGQVIEGL
ncbi:MAG: efflux RND transporter periplasmic adaptor subunit [Anaerolineae bacterium]|nr:efflux RND transporter periplasmic adaptor subunit [Anaerolineae bacterium]